MADKDPAQLNIFSEDFQQAPHDWLRALREEAPVLTLDNGWVLVTTTPLVKEVLADPVTYSNAVARRTPPPPEVAQEVAAIRVQGNPYIPTMLMNDPPRHTRFRKLAQKGFTPRTLAWMEPLVAQVADDLAAALPTGQPVDFITAFSRPLPIWAISKVLGLPDEMRDDIKRWTDAGTAAIGAQLPPHRWPEVERDLLDYQRTMTAEYERRRSDPVPGLLTTLLQAADTDDGPEEERIGTPELVAMTRELLLAGNESSLRLLASMVLFLDQNPDEWDKIRQDPSRVDAVVEETLRLASPSQSVFRLTTRDTVLDGVPITAGTQVVLSLMSANQDDRQFVDAAAFNPDRSDLTHLSFGAGIHTCVGARLSRLEARHALRALAQNVDRLEVVPGELKYVPSMIVRGLEALPVTVLR